jgi:nucleoside-diphosphate-sugar epimerase
VRILMIGGSGMTGPHIVRALIAQGHSVHLLHRTATASPLLAGAHFWQGDKARLTALRPDLVALAPQVIVHMVAFNQQDAADLLVAARGVAERLVVISSIDVYRAYGRFNRTEPGPLEAVPLRETAPLRTCKDTLHSGYEKVAVERVASSDPSLPCTILRYPAVYGTGDAQHRLRPWVRRIDDGRKVIMLGVGQAGFRFHTASVENVAAAAALAMTHPQAIGRTFNLGDRAPLSMAAWAEGVAQALHWDGRIITVPDGQLPSHLANTYDYRQDLVADTGLLRTVLGYREPVTHLDGLLDAIAWERAHAAAAGDLTAEYATEDATLKRLPGASAPEPGTDGCSVVG